MAGWRPRRRPLGVGQTPGLHVLPVHTACIAWEDVGGDLSGRDRGPSETRVPNLSLAEELARRAAAAADNARMYGEMERARRRAEDASRAKDRLLATLSHELRTPLTPVLLTLGALLDDPGTPEAMRQQLEEGRRGVELEARLIDDLLDATRAGSGKLRLERQPVDAHAVVREAVATCGEAIRLAGVRLELDLTARRRFLSADPARLQQVVWNLVKNSAKFTPSGGTITVRSREILACECQGGGGACLLIEVSDTGAGIESGLLGTIFEPFEQGGAARGEQSGGLGLGLAIARGIAEAHDGRLTASSAGKVSVRRLPWNCPSRPSR